MRNGHCTACGAATVRGSRNGVELSEHAGQAVLRPHTEPGFRGALRPQRADVWAFVCVTCGHLELGLYDPDALAFVQQQWAAIPPQPAG